MHNCSNLCDALGRYLLYNIFPMSGEMQDLHASSNSTLVVLEVNNSQAVFKTISKALTRVIVLQNNWFETWLTTPLKVLLGPMKEMMGKINSSNVHNPNWWKTDLNNYYCLHVQLRSRMKDDSKQLALLAIRPNEELLIKYGWI